MGGTGGAVHPFMVGLAMETLIHWYELNMAEGHPDYRVLPVIKEGAGRAVEVQLAAQTAHV